MAFNPFAKFRKHQKVIFAGLTILCMLTFVLTGVSGHIGDVFQEITGLLSSRHSITEVARLYGKSLDRNTLLTLREERRRDCVVHPTGGLMYFLRWRESEEIDEPDTQNKVRAEDR